MNETEREKNRLKVARYRARKKARELGLDPDMFFKEEEIEDVEEDEYEGDEEEEDEYEDDLDDFEEEEDEEDVPIRNVSSSSQPSRTHWGLITSLVALALVLCIVSFMAGRYSLLRHPLIDTSSQLAERQETPLKATSEREVLDETRG